MRILVSSVGTRGDVQPAVALALQLRALGHEPRLCAPPNFTAWIEGLGFEVRPIGIEMRAPRPGEPAPVIPDLIADQFETVEAAADGCGLIVGAGAHQYAVRSVAERLGVPCVVAVYAPISLPASDAPAVWDETRRGWNARALERVNANRSARGLTPIDDVLTHILGARPWLACDPLLGPAPDAPGLDIVQTGAWILPDAAALPADLEAFLRAGEPPVYLGFGSMPAAPDAARALIEAARAVGRRAVLSQGWAGFERVDDGADVFVTGDVSHPALFPRMAAVVHHGGAGTTTAAALAGVPQVIVPLFGDQPYWAGRVETLGLGVRASSNTQDAAGLARALEAALDPETTARAGAFAPKVATDGAAATARRLLTLTAGQ